MAPRTPRANLEKQNESKKRKVPSCRQIRLEEIENAVQEALNMAYFDPEYMRTKALKFDVGDPVVSCHYGLYYSATIKEYSHLMAPNSMYSVGADIPVEMKVPTVVLHFDGWGNKHDSEVPENELFNAFFRKRPIDTLALLVAHEWNLLRRDQLAIEESDLGLSAFLMDDKTYAAVEAAWKQDSGERSSFGQFCGREPGPYHSLP